MSNVNIWPETALVVITLIGVGITLYNTIKKSAKDTKTEMLQNTEKYFDVRFDAATKSIDDLTQAVKDESNQTKNSMKDFKSEIKEEVNKIAENVKSNTERIIKLEAKINNNPSMVGFIQQSNGIAPNLKTQQVEQAPKA